MGGSEICDNDSEHRRMSVRDKRPVNYNSIAQGTSELSASMDYGEVSGQNQRAAAAASVKSSQKAMTQFDNKDVKLRCEQVFTNLRCHPNIGMFLEPLDPNHPKF